MATRKQLAEFVARRMLSDIQDHGDLEEWSEKLLGYPEKYLFDLALSAVDCINLCNALKYDEQK